MSKEMKGRGAEMRGELHGETLYDSNDVAEDH